MQAKNARGANKKRANLRRPARREEKRNYVPATGYHKIRGSRPGKTKSARNRFSLLHFVAFIVTVTLMAFTKLFASITDSTIWRESDHTRILWITMLAMADRDGVVSASIPGLADRARIPIEATLIALDKLKAPDEWSRSKENEGRRIADVDGGWILLNYEKYRARATAEQTREKTAERVARFRARNAENAKVTGVTKCNAGNAIAEAEAEADLKEKEKEKEKPKRKSRVERDIEEIGKEMGYKQ